MSKAVDRIVSCNMRSLARAPTWIEDRVPRLSAFARVFSAQRTWASAGGAVAFTEDSPMENCIAVLRPADIYQGPSNR
jgi:hypothetical protein